MKLHLLFTFCILFACESINSKATCQELLNNHIHLASLQSTDQSLASNQDNMPVVAPLRSLDQGNTKPISPANSQDNKEPLPSQDNNTGVQAAPGADAMMTRDFLLVSPNKSKVPPQPLQNFVGKNITLTTGRSDVILDGLRGIMITVTNNTSRPLFIDGHDTKATSGGNTYTAVPVAEVQKAVLPNNSAVAKVYRLVLDSSLGLFSVGAIPTVKDYITMKKPINKRYGADERRRIVEASRFGKRILWPHDKTSGILYFRTRNTFSNVKLEIPIHTLFDKPDSALLTN